MDDSDSITADVAGRCEKGRMTEQGINLFAASSVTGSEIESLIEKSTRSCIRKLLSLMTLLQVSVK